MRPFVPRLAPLLLLAALFFLPAPSSTASCVGPSLTVPDQSSPANVTLGFGFAVNGQYFHNGCADAVTSDSFGCHHASDTETPMTGIVLRLRQAGHTWDLGTADAGSGLRLGHVHWSVRVPADAKVGRAVLVADTARLPVFIRPWM